MWREKLIENMIGEWVGPFDVEGVECNNKSVVFRDVNIGASRPFKIVQVKPYFTPEILSHAFITDL